MNPALLSDSPTVATLNARAELRRLRILATALGINPNAEGIREEIDRLEDLLSDALHVEDTDSFVTQETVDREYVLKSDYDALQDEKGDMERERDDMEIERDDFERQLDEATDALEADDDETRQKLGEALKRLSTLEADARALRDKIARVEGQRDQLRKTSAAQQLTQRVRDALFPLPRGAKGKAAEAFERLVVAVRKALEVEP